MPEDTDMVRDATVEALKALREQAQRVPIVLGVAISHMYDDDYPGAVTDVGHARDILGALQLDVFRVENALGSIVRDIKVMESIVPKPTEEK